MDVNLQPLSTPSFETTWKILLVKIQSQSEHSWHLILPFCAISSGSTSGERSDTQGVPLLLCLPFFFPEKYAKNRFTTLAERFSISLPHPKVLFHNASAGTEPHLLYPSFPAFPITPSRRLKKKCAFNFNGHAIPLKAHRGSGPASQQQPWHCDCQKRHQPRLAKMCVLWKRQHECVVCMQCHHTWRWILVFRKEKY